MARIGVFRLLCALPLLLLHSPAAADESAADVPRILRAETHRERAVDLRRWDAASPQKLVRLDGTLYQESAGHYYPVIPERLSVRLADGVGDWDELVLRAEKSSPATFAILTKLEPLRKNRLGIVDLAAPRGADLVEWCALIHATGLVRYAEVATYGAYDATQNDAQYADQWALNNTGQTGGTPGADIDAERAWDLTAGDPAIVVAVLDSGTDIDHEDLAANVWHNPGEIPANGIDDDGNGFTDDWEGWDFDNNDNDPRATFYHGTHVTGIVNAVGSNGIGIAGLAGGVGSPGVRGMAINVGQSAPNGGIVDEAILYAADNGADVITLSLSIGETQAINDALAYAYGSRDAFIDCAAGNSGSEVTYPGTRPECMAVGSTDANDSVSGFSNPGPEVEVAAPGSNVLSTQIGDSYGVSSGTSFAAPYVAGLAGLIRSRNPGMTAPDVRQLIIDTAEDVDAPGFDDNTGYGRINAFDAVTGAASSDGTVRMDASGYACDGIVSVTVSDIDLAGGGALALPIGSETEPSIESVSLSESGAGSGLFRGSIALSAGAALEDGSLQVIDGDTITLGYTDADDGSGGIDVLKAATARVDCRSPSIDGVQAVSVSNTSATIVWTTDETATSRVRYGESPPPSLETAGSGVTGTHSVTLGNLAECTNYHYSVESADPLGNLTVDDNAGAYHAFRTLGNFPGSGIVSCNTGRIELDHDDSYGCSAVVGLTLIDIDLDTDGSLAETETIRVTSTTEPAGEWVTLTESSNQSGRFEGTLPLDTGPAVPGDGLLAVAPGDLITGTYHDQDDGTGIPRVTFDSAVAECDAPQIRELQLTEITSTRAIVSWTTDEPATSRVDFGRTSALSDFVEETTLKTTHALAISAFDACERGFLTVSSADQHGQVGRVDAAGQPLAFNLNQIGGLVFHDNFESDSGWQLDGDWERGSPGGLGSPSGDPLTAWSGSSIIGNDLSGQGSYPGDYEPSSNVSAISPAIDTRRMRSLELIVRRKLGVTSSDEAGIYVNDGSETQVWTSNYQANDDDWLERRYDISVVDNKNSVQIEFRIESADPDHGYGWNIDELVIKESTEPDYLICGACGGAPAFSGVARVEDPDPCGAGGLVVSWEAAVAWGTGSGGSYDIYRGTAPDFVPDGSTLVASDVTAISWTDSTAPVDTPLWYVVRARNDESCSGGVGLDDGNTLRMQGVETTSQSAVSPVGNGLIATTVGDAHVRLEWQAVAGAARYVIRRAVQPDFSDAVQLGSTAGTVFEDAGTVTDGNSYGYRVYAVDRCDREE